MNYEIINTQIFSIALFSLFWSWIASFIFENLIDRKPNIGEYISIFFSCFAGALVSTYSPYIEYHISETFYIVSPLSIWFFLFWIYTNYSIHQKLKTILLLFLAPIFIAILLGLTMSTLVNFL
jgi:hypothetical protein